MNWIALSAETEDVVRDAAGVPVEWTLLRIGSNPICQEGQDGAICLNAEAMNQIVEYHAKKGELIPVDSEHYLFELASRKHLDEAEALKMFPGGVAALGYGALSLSGEKLRIRVQWTPAAHEMLKEKIYKYFSPVLRGLEKGPLRVTSVAMTNTPAINHLDALAASANKPSGRPDRKDKMDRITKAIGKLLRRDSLALEGETPEKEKDQIACEIEGKADLLDRIRELLGLNEDAGMEEMIAALKGMDEKAKSADEKQSQLDELAASAEKEAHARQVARGRAERKIVDADMEYVNSLDSKALSAYLDHTSPKFPQPLTRNAADGRQGDTAALTAEEKTACRLARVSEEQFLKSKRERMK